MNNWIDTHTHLDIISKDSDQQQSIVDESLQNKIIGIITISTGIESYFSGKKISLNNPNYVYTTCGLYPSYAEKYDSNLRNKLIEQLNEGIAIAIGEIGIDYHWNYGTPDQQIKLFRDQIHLAKEYNLPIIIHCRESHDDVYKVLKEESPIPKGVMHCFSGTPEQANQYMELGLYISFAGNVTYKKAVDLHQSCLAVPMDRIVLETDAPYLTPIPHRGKKNYPYLIKHTGEFVSNLKQLPLEEVSQATCDNAKKLFGLTL